MHARMGYEEHFLVNIQESILAHILVDIQDLSQEISATYPGRKIR